VSFASVVYPIKNVTIGAYFHEPLRNEGGGAIFPQTDEITNEVTPLPNFYLPRDGNGPVSRDECAQIVFNTNDPFACVEYGIDPFVSALSVRQQTYGLAAGWQVLPKLSIGATVRFQRLNESAATLRYKEVTQNGQTFYQLSNISYQATAKVNNAGDIDVQDATDVTFGAGFKWSPAEWLSVGGVYKQGGSFAAPLFFAGAQTNNDVVQVAEPTFHMPDVAGLGISIRPIPVLTVNVDAVHVTYSNLVDDFISLAADVQDLENPYRANDVTELRVGAEYLFTTRIPFALRGGFWRDPAHSVEYSGPLNNPQFVAEALLYPKGEASNHMTIGAGISWPRFQIDVAYDTSDRYKVGSISMVTRF
jgi:long-subunit fatty acid transport protein